MTFFNEQPLTKKTCAYCGKIFRVARFAIGVSTKWCSPECSKAARTLICELCGKPFVRWDHHYPKFCSKNCLSIFLRWWAISKTKRILMYCLNCGASLMSQRGKRFYGEKFCSAKCYHEYRHKHPPPQRTCPQCGKKFAYVKKRQKYCSLACSRAARVGPKQILNICVMCGKEYIETLKPGKGRMPRTKYCSDECRKKGRKESCLKNNENRTYVCLNCGKTFHRIKDHRFCDKTCYLEYISKHKFLAIEAVCINCGKTYIKTHKTQQYCSKSCYKQVQCADDLFSTAKCKTCGKPFVKEGPDQTCCSADCYLISLSQ